MFDFWAFLLQTLTLSGVALLILTLKAIFRDKLPPRWQFWIWGVLGVSMLIPAGFGGRYVLFNWPMVVDWLKILTGDYGTTRVLFPFPVLNAFPLSVFDWLFAIYALGVIGSVLRELLAYIRLRRAIRPGGRVSDAFTERIQRIADEHHLKTSRTMIAEGLPSAFVYGMIRPVLVLPGEDVDDKVIVHELIHLKNRDTVWSVVICLLRSLHWCNPLLRFCARQSLNDLEARCDQMVLELLEGEDRRDYGRILLSMANDRYARTPGATCINNGGSAIRQRIEAIARFKRYPAGMKLVSVCAGIVLALTVFIGSPAAAVDFDGNQLELASARTVYCSTPAGAFDCYAKSVLNRNAAGRIMCAPEAQQEMLAKSFPYWDSGVPAWPDVNSGYYIYNLSCRDEIYEGLLVIRLSGNLDGALEENTLYLAYQPLRVERENGRWVTYAEGDFQTVSTPETLAIINWECWALPCYRYVGETEDFRIEIQHQTVHEVENWSYESGFFGSTQLFDRTPKPNAVFSQVAVSHNGKVFHLGTQEERNAMSHLGIGVERVMPGEEPPERTEIYYHQSSSSSSGDGSGWSNRTLEEGWGPALNLYGGGSKFPPDSDSSELPEYYFIDLYIDRKYATSLRLTLEEGERMP